MNISQLECFVSLANTLNFMKTADQLGITQPAVSKQIKAVEEELGAALFYRTSRSVALTPIGSQFLFEAANMLSIYHRSIEEIRACKSGRNHTLRIGYSDPHVMHHTSPVLKSLLEEYPEDNLVPEFVQDQTDANLRRLQNNQLDLVLGMRDARFDDSRIYFDKLHEDHFQCVCSRTHSLAAPFLSDPDMKHTITSSQIWPYRQILSIPPYLLKTRYARGHRILPVNDSVTNIICSNSSEAYTLALSGIGYALIPDHLVIPHPALIFLKWEESPHSAFGIYHHKLSAEGSLVKTFLRTAKSSFLTESLSPAGSSR